MIRKGILILIYFLSFLFGSRAQEDTSHLRISLLTCSPGEELYSTFGHSALRVIDSLTYTDKIYNYGTFEFGPDFYSKFIRGKLLYYLSVENYPDFLYGYQLEERSIEEQKLNLTGEEKMKLQKALQLNASGNNKYYKYDFLFDNCATRIRDIVSESTTETPLIKNILPYSGITFRDMIHQSLNNSKMYWSKLGIDILLGSGLDKASGNVQTMFLPEYLFKGFDSATVGNLPLVGSKQTLYKAPELNQKQKPFFTPFLSFSLLLIAFIALTLIRQPWSNKLIPVLDFLLFFSAGILGILLVFMWTGTDHALCRSNYNLLWAPPFHAIAAFYLHSKRKIMSQYLGICVLLYTIILAFWAILPQELNKDLVPLIILFIWRSWSLFKQSENARKLANI